VCDARRDCRHRAHRVHHRRHCVFPGAYWQAGEGSEPRRIAQLLIERLEF
jgi:hypothetical protein